MLGFLKYVFATMVGIFLFSFVGFVLLVGLVKSAGKKSVVTIESNSVLKLDANYKIPEKSEDNPFAAFDFNTMKSEEGHRLYMISAKRSRLRPKTARSRYLPAYGCQPQRTGYDRGAARTAQGVQKER
jgi:protease-4